MTSQRNSRVDSASRIIAAPPAALYRAHMDPQALISWSFNAVPSGTEVTVRCENVPTGIRPEDHAAGRASSLANLAAYCE